MKPFTHHQNYLIERGKINTELLEAVIRQSLGISNNSFEAKKHAYIFSTPGAGKTFTVQKIAEENNIQMVKIHGRTTLSSMCATLAVASYRNLNSGKELIVWVDDCDSIFLDENSLNVMKGALDAERNMFSYGANVTNQIISWENSPDPDDNLRAAAYRHFQNPGAVGVEVPTDNMRFIVTSNLQLTAPADVQKGKPSKRKMHEAAIRDRVTYKSFLLNADDSWGWVSHLVLTTDALSFKDKKTGAIVTFDEEQKHILLDWMLTNWQRLPATSMRAVKDYAVAMINNPTNYVNYWEAQLR